jgi:hypothetical protein
MKKYYLYDGTTQHGPFDLADLETKIITPQTMVWHESLPDWKPASEIDELKGLLNTKVPAAQILTPPLIKAKEEDWSKKQYYCTDSHGQQGPFTLEQLKNRNINANTQVWYDPLPEWTTADKIPGLKDIIGGASKSSAPAATQPEGKKQYYYLDGAGQKQGPFTLDQLNGKPINAATLIWYDPLPEWIKAGNEESLKNIVAQAQPASVTPSPQKKLYYYLDTAGQKQGPFTLEQLNGKSITASTLIWYEPLTEWVKAGSDETLKSIVAAAQPVQNVAGGKRMYYYMDAAGQQQGPFTADQLNGKPITASTLIWYDSLPQWIKAGSDDSLKSIVGGGANGVDWSKKLFYYTDATGQQGPFTLEQLRGRPLTAATPVWYDPLPNWTTAGQVEGLRGIIR